MISAIPLVVVIGILLAIAAVLIDYSKPLPGISATAVQQPQRDAPSAGAIELVHVAISALGTGLASMVAGCDPGTTDLWMEGAGTPDREAFARLTVALAAFSVVQHSTGDVGMARSWLISDQGVPNASPVDLLQRNQFAGVLESARLLAVAQ